MITEIDVDPTSLQYEQLTQLDGREYLLRFLWQDRYATWLLNIYDQDGNALALGIALVLNSRLLRRFQTDARVPPGLLFCADMTEQDLEIEAATDLGTRVLLVYVTQDDELLL